MQDRIYWNHNWQFIDEICMEDLQKGWENSQIVSLPHTVQITPLRYFDEQIYQKNCGYRRVFEAPAEWAKKSVCMTVEAAGHSAWVYVNGKEIASHHCGYTAFCVDLSKELLPGEQNELIIRVDSREQQNIPPFGHVIDYMTFGGLYREVYVEVKEKTHIQDVFVKTKRLKPGRFVLTGEVTIAYENEDSGAYRIKQSLLDTNGVTVLEFPENEQIHEVSSVLEWNTEKPALYILKTELFLQDKLLDTKLVRFGFREAVFKEDGFYLNGKKIKIRGLNRHQSYPYVGYAMPKSMQRLDAEILKYELGANAVRTSHYPQSQHFIDRCDELGLLVFTEIPGWQYIGDKKWKKQAVKNTRDMVLQYRNHPSIILWGVRINESQDNDALYRKTNEVAHQLDDTRQTSGVRYLQKSSLLEDVYAYNDFSHEGNNRGCQKKTQNTPDRNKGYVISEYNGHMFPTKAFDAEDHRVEHFLRHARVMNAYYGEEDIAGGFAWCMFDYHTHQDFGSGDRICYHGVCDMFRNPKLAAFLYQSQQEKQDVLEISSAMDIGEHPACLMKDVYAITNADSVRVYKNDTFIREFSAAETPFPNIPHGPVLIDDFIGTQMETGEGFGKQKSEDIKKILMSACRNGMGNLPLSTKLLAAKCMLFRGMKMQDAIDLYNRYVGNWGGTATVYKFEAVKNGKVVKTVIKQPMKTAHLEVICSHTQLQEDTTYDVAGIRIKVVSEDGNILPFANTTVFLKTTGEISVIGPEVITLEGGMGGTYVRTNGSTGEGMLTITSEQYGEEKISFTVSEKDI